MFPRHSYTTTLILFTVTNNRLLSFFSLLRWIPSLALWGGAAAGAVTLFFSAVPIFQSDVLKHIPVVATYFEGAFSAKAYVGMSYH